MSYAIMQAEKDRYKCSDKVLDSTFQGPHSVIKIAGLNH